MNILEKLIGRKTKEKKAEEKPAADILKMNRIIDALRERTEKPVIRITAKAAEGVTIFDSKFGGLPYWTSKKVYPVNSEGEKLYLLAQINLESVKTGTGVLPDKGILQFFIAADDLYGQDMYHQTNQDGFRVVYHEHIDERITAAQVKAMGIPVNTELDPKQNSFPFYREFSLTLRSDAEGINLCDIGIDAVMNRVIKEDLGEENFTTCFGYFSDADYEYLYDNMKGWGAKLLGYPAFTQADPRSDISGNPLSPEVFDTLLLQIDSDCRDILWGDSGICNFFINSEALKNCDFSNVLYNWDCY